LRRGAPDSDDTVQTVLSFEVANVLAKLFCEITLGLPALHIFAVNTSHITIVERRRHRLDLAKEIREWFDVALLEHSRFARGRERIVGDWIPGAEHQIVELRQRDELLDQRCTLLRALSQANRRHLSQRADWFREAAPDTLDAGDESRRDRAESRR